MNVSNTSSRETRGINIEHSFDEDELRRATEKSLVSDTNKKSRIESQQNLNTIRCIQHNMTNDDMRK